MAGGRVAGSGLVSGQRPFDSTGTPSHDASSSAAVAAAAATAAFSGLVTRLATFQAAAPPSGPIAHELPFAQSDESDPLWGESGFGDGRQAALAVLEATPAGTARVSGAEARSVGAVLSCSRQGELLWTSVLPSMAVLLAGNSSFAAVACADRSVVLFTAAGRRATTAMRPCAGGIAALAADSDNSLLLVGTHGDVLVWRGLPQQPRCTLRCSAAALIEHGSSEAVTEAESAVCAEGASAGSAMASVTPPTVPLLGASLLPGGRPLLLLRHGAFTFCEVMQAWLSIGDEAFAGSEFRSSLPATPRYPPPPTTSAPAPPSLSGVQRQQGSAEGRGSTQSAARLAASLATIPPDKQRLISLAHLEHQIAATCVLGNAHEYREWLGLYARTLAQQMAVRQIRELCDELLGPLDQPSAPGGAGAMLDSTNAPVGDPTMPIAPLTWQPTVLGLCKRGLLKATVLPALSTNRSLQRILSEYIEQITHLGHE